MTIKTSGSLSFTDIAEEFGLPSDSDPNNKNSLGSYRISESVGSLTNLSIDRNVPRSGAIKFSDFYGKRLNIVVYYTNDNIGSPSVSVGNINVKNTYDNNVVGRVRVLGGYLSRPDDPTDKRIIINVNRFLASQKSSTTSSFNDVNRRKCAIRTGNWSVTPPASMVMEVGSAGEIYGAAGDGGNAETQSNPLPNAANGRNGTSAIGIEYPTVVVNRGYIQCGFGGGGGGGWNRYNDGAADSGGGGGGGGAGAERWISGSPLVNYVPSNGGVTSGFPQDPPGTDGQPGSRGTIRTAGTGGAGGVNNQIIGAGGTGGYFSPSINGWDVRYGKFTNRFIGIGTIEGNPEGLFWHPEGVHVYVTGQNTDFVHRFTSQVPWEIDTILWDGPTKRFSVNVQDARPAGIFFKPDGTRMYVAGNVNNRIYQYDLSTAWDVSTSVYNSVSLLVGVGTDLHDLWWKPDGSSVYAVTNNNNRIIQFDISSPVNYWNIGFANNTSGRFFDMGNIDNTPLGMCFKPDGTKMYIAGQQRSRIYEFTLSTPWLINNVGNVTPPNTSFNNSVHKSLFISDQDNSPRGVFIRQDNGESLYVTGTQNNRLYQYSLSSQYGEGGGVSDVFGGKPGYPGFSFVSTSSTSLTIDPTSTGTIIGLSTVGSIPAFV